MSTDNVKINNRLISTVCYVCLIEYNNIPSWKICIFIQTHIYVRCFITTYRRKYVILYSTYDSYCFNTILQTGTTMHLCAPTEKTTMLCYSFYSNDTRALYTLCSTLEIFREVWTTWKSKFIQSFRVFVRRTDVVFSGAQNVYPETA